MSRSNPTVAPHYPRGWKKEYQSLSDKIAQFAARFRVAKAFTRVTFQAGISADTSRGYAMMTYAFLATTAFEAFSRAFGMGADKKREQIEKTHADVALYDRIRELAYPDCTGFLNFLKEDDRRASKSAKDNIKAIFKGEDFCVITLADSIRNAFAHGRVTPNVWKSKASAVADLCKAVAEFLVMVMDAEASKRCEGYKQKLKANSE